MTKAVTPREAALVDAVRSALSCLGHPTGYFPDLGAPITRKLQRAFEAYEPHPVFAQRRAAKSPVPDQGAYFGTRADGSFFTTGV